MTPTRRAASITRVPLGTVISMPSIVSRTLLDAGAVMGGSNSAGWRAAVFLSWLRGGGGGGVGSRPAGGSRTLLDAGAVMGGSNSAGWSAAVILSWLRDADAADSTLPP